MDSITAVTLFFAGLVGLAVVVGVVAVGLAARLVVSSRRTVHAAAQPASAADTGRANPMPRGHLSNVPGH